MPRLKYVFPKRAYEEREAAALASMEKAKHLAEEQKERRREQSKEPFWVTHPVRNISRPNLDPDGLRRCEHCGGGINPYKRSITKYCSHSCRTLAYLTRKIVFGSQEDQHG